MPQLDQFASTFASQLFWLLIVFGLIYFVIGRGMVTKIEATVDQRDRRISDDLAEAERARARADEIEEGYRVRTEQSRAEALKVTQAAKDAAALENEARIRTADAASGEKITAAETRLRAATAAALAEIEDVAAEAAQDLVAKLSGATVTRTQAAEAVQSAFNKEAPAHG